MFKTNLFCLFFLVLNSYNEAKKLDLSMVKELMYDIIRLNVRDVHNMTIDAQEISRLHSNITVSMRLFFSKIE